MDRFDPVFLHQCHWGQAPIGPIRKKWPKTASNTLYRLKTWVQSRHRENLKSNEEIEARCRFRIHIFDRLKVFWGRLDQFFGPRSSGAWLQCHLCKKTGQIDLDWPLRPVKTFRSGFLPYTAKIQNFNLVKGLRFWLQFQNYQKNPNRRGCQKGPKKKCSRGVFL